MTEVRPGQVWRRAFTFTDDFEVFEVVRVASDRAYCKTLPSSVSTKGGWLFTKRLTAFSKCELVKEVDHA